MFHLSTVSVSPKLKHCQPLQRNAMKQIINTTPAGFRTATTEAVELIIFIDPSIYQSICLSVCVFFQLVVQVQ